MYRVVVEPTACIAREKFVYKKIEISISCFSQSVTAVEGPASFSNRTVLARFWHVFGTGRMQFWHGSSAVPARFLHGPGTVPARLQRHSGTHHSNSWLSSAPQYQRTSGSTTSPAQGLTEHAVVNSSLSVQIAGTSLFQARV